MAAGDGTTVDHPQSGSIRQVHHTAPVIVSISRCPPQLSILKWAEVREAASQLSQQVRLISRFPTTIHNMKAYRFLSPAHLNVLPTPYTRLNAAY